MQTRNTFILVFDIGKTHIKVTLLDASGEPHYQNRTSNKVKDIPPYIHHDVEYIWAWFLQELTQLATQHTISAISIATHGATAALIDTTRHALLMPVMDYEFNDFPPEFSNYTSLRPSFDITGSPELPAGLNLGRQLYWQSQQLTSEQKSKTALLLYPQYWAWRLCGVLSSEITSLGCHTDLWDVKNNQPSPLLQAMGLGNSLPPLVKAWESLGPITPALAAKTGLNPNCQIYPGIHDSNAGYLPVLKIPTAQRPTVISTGTWTIIMDRQAPIDNLQPTKDMLVNIDAEGSPLATARFMGGREFELICEHFNTDIATTFTDADVQKIIDQDTYVLPTFCKGAGPYHSAVGRVTPGVKTLEINGKAAATLYAALMISDILHRLNPNSQNDILIEGSFAANTVLCSLIATLNPQRSVRIQNRGNGVTDGCFLLTCWQAEPVSEVHTRIQPYKTHALADYAQGWNTAVKQLDTCPS